MCWEIKEINKDALWEQLNLAAHDEEPKGPQFQASEIARCGGNSARFFVERLYFGTTRVYRCSKSVVSHLKTAFHLTGNK